MPAAATRLWAALLRQNSQHLLEPLGYLPPAEYEAQYYTAQTTPGRGGGTQLTESPEHSGRFILDPSHLLAPLATNARYADLIGYLRQRYWA